MSGETGVIDPIEDGSALNDLSGNINDATQPNIDGLSPESGLSAFKEESDEPAKDKEEYGSTILPAPKVGIRVKRELLAFDANIDESVNSPEPASEKEDGNAKMVEFPTVWPCPTCGYTYMSSQELQEHQPSCRHTLTRPHLCDFCTESFERKQDLNNHIVCHQTNRPHACRVCGNLHRTKIELMAHMLTHQVDKPHKCQTCGQEFQRHSSLTNHMKIHTYAAGRALVPPMFSPIKGNSPLPPIMPPMKRNQSIQPERSTDPIPSFETLPGPAFYYNSLINSANYAFLASKLLNNGALSSRPGEQDLNLMQPSHLDALASSSANPTQITCLPDIGHPDVDGSDDLSSDFMPQPGFSVDEQNQFDSVPEVPQATEQERVLNSYLSVKNAGLVYGIKVEEQTHQDQNTQNESEGSPEQDSTMNETQNDDLLRDIRDSDPEKAPSPDPKTSKESSNESMAPKPHMCQFCGIHFARLKAYQSHMKLHDENWETGYLCQVCGQKFPDYVALSLHALKCMRGSRRDNDFTLSDVPAMSPNDSPSARANALNKQSFKHVCSSCDKRFATKQKLFRHMWIHRKKVFTCEACSEVFEERELLDKHRLEAHPPNDATPYACTVCGKSFTSRQTLWEHGRVHGGTGSGATLLWCQECNKSFASRQGYQIHTRTHTGERPYGCRYCMKSFRDGGTLRKHERIHTGERPHACPLCLRAFNQKVVLREHVRWVHAATTTGEPPLPCVLCDTTLPDREALCAHIVKHSDDLATEVRNASKVSNTVPKPRRPARKSNKVLLQAADGKYVAIEKEDLPMAPTPRSRAAQPTATTTSDDSSHSTPGSPHNFPKMEPRPTDLSSSQADCDSSFYSTSSAARPGSSKGESSEEENTPIPSFSEIAPSRADKRAPNVTVADIPGAPYNLMNRDISLPSTSLDADMIDPMAYMQVVTDISPNHDGLSVDGQETEESTEEP